MRNHAPTAAIIDEEKLVFRVLGDAMVQPIGDSFPAGTRLYVDDSIEADDLEDGDYAVFYLAVGKAGARDIFGRYNGTARRLEFLNPAYPPLDLAGLHSAGRVTESVTTIYRRPESASPHLEQPGETR